MGVQSERASFCNFLKGNITKMSERLACNKQ